VVSCQAMPTRFLTSDYEVWMAAEPSRRMKKDNKVQKMESAGSANSY